MSFPALVEGCSLRTLAAVLVLASAANALADECQSDFERWVALSESRLRVEQQANAACLPSEAVRQELLNSLARAAAKCQNPSSPDQSTQHTRTMITINEGFVGTLPLCRAQEQPAQTATEPPHPAQPAKPSRPCLEMSSLKPGQYMLSNRHCVDSKVLAIVEIKKSTGETECKVHTIEKRLVLATQNALRPQLNYDCPLNVARCTKEFVSKMFPECDW